MLIIIGAAFLFEDVTIVIVGVLAAGGALSVPLALVALYLGIILGDFGMYGLGRLARTHPRLARYVDHGLILPLRNWLRERLRITVFSTRCIPGTRLPTFFASGFFRAPLSVFCSTIVAAAALWTILLFTAAYLFGSFTATWVEEARWGALVVALGALFLIARHNLRAYLAKKNEQVSLREIQNSEAQNTR